MLCARGEHAREKQSSSVILREHWTHWGQCWFGNQEVGKKPSQLHSLVNRDNSRKVSSLSYGSESSGSLEGENVNSDDPPGQLSEL